MATAAVIAREGGLSGVAVTVEGVEEVWRGGSRGGGGSAEEGQEAVVA